MREEDTVCVGSTGLRYCKVCGEAKTLLNTNRGEEKCE